MILKIIVSDRRRKVDKKSKDLDAAIRVMRALIDKGEVNKLKFFFMGFTLKLRKKIINILKDSDRLDLVEIFA